MKAAVSEWVDDKAPRLGASLAYYALLSMAPLLIVVIAVAAFAVGRDAVTGQLMWQIRDWIGAKGAAAIQDLLRSAYHPGTGIFATVLSLLTLLLAASSIVLELQDALNTIWHVPPPPGKTGIQNVIAFVKGRFFSIGLILGAGFMVMVSLLLNTVIAGLGKFVGSVLPIPEFILHIVTFIFSFLVIAVLFGAIYKILPDVHLEWGDVVVGAVFTSVLFALGKQLISLYLGKATFSSTYGAAGSLVMVLVWVYYSAQIFFLGAEFTKVFARRHGSHRDKP